jgi:apolipoprotein D and lipocalin family protein
MKQLLLSFFLLGFVGCKGPEELPTVKKLDLDKYQGKWYEIARLPNGFEKNLKCTTAEYTFKKNGKIRVLNKGFSMTKEKYKKAEGTAWVPAQAYPARLKVSFFGPFAGNYYVIELDENYAYALVGDPSRKYLWILSRTPQLDNKIYEHLVATAKAQGFPVDELIKVTHDCR